MTDQNIEKLLSDGFRFSMELGNGLAIYERGSDWIVYDIDDKRIVERHFPSDYAHDPMENVRGEEG